MARAARRLASIAAVTVGVVAGGIAAVPADAQAGGPRWGVVTGAPMSASDLGRARQARVKTIRLPLYWRSVEVAPATGPGCLTAVYNWDRYDDFVRGAGRRGIKILPFFLGSPRYAAKRSSQAPSTRSPAIEDYKCFVRAAVGRYGPGGIGGGITEWQVWNEPNLPMNAARGKVNPAEYGRLVKVTSGAIKGVHRRAKIVLAGMPEKAGDAGMLARTFLRKLYKVKGIRRAFDAVALHPYGENQRTVKDYLTRTRKTLKGVGDRRRRIWITEVGYPTHGYRKRERPAAPERWQAKQLTKTFRMIKRNRKRFKIGTVHWFRWRDSKSYAENTGWWGDYAGLYRVGGAPKRSCNAYARFTGGHRPCRAIK